MPPRLYKVICPERGIVLGDRIEEAADTVSRMRGLLGRTGLEPGQGLLLRDCSMIHMIGMMFRIDVVYLSHDLVVKKIVRDVPLWGMSWGGFRRVAHTLELPANLEALNGLQPGDKLVFTITQEAS